MGMPILADAGRSLLDCNQQVKWAWNCAKELDQQIGCTYSKQVVGYALDQLTHVLHAVPHAQIYNALQSPKMRILEIAIYRIQNTLIRLNDRNTQHTMDVLSAYHGAIALAGGVAAIADKIRSSMPDFYKHEIPRNIAISFFKSAENYGMSGNDSNTYLAHAAQSFLHVGDYLLGLTELQTDYARMESTALALLEAAMRLLDNVAYGSDAYPVIESCVSDIDTLVTFMGLEPIVTDDVHPAFFRSVHQNINSHLIEIAGRLIASSKRQYGQVMSGLDSYMWAWPRKDQNKIEIQCIRPVIRLVALTNNLTSNNCDMTNLFPMTIKYGDRVDIINNQNDWTQCLIHMQRQIADAVSNEEVTRPELPTNLSTIIKKISKLSNDNSLGQFLGVKSTRPDHLSHSPHYLLPEKKRGQSDILRHFSDEDELLEHIIRPWFNARRMSGRASMYAKLLLDYQSLKGNFEKRWSQLIASSNISISPHKQRDYKVGLEALLDHIEMVNARDEIPLIDKKLSLPKMGTTVVVHPLPSIERLSTGIFDRRHAKELLMLPETLNSDNASTPGVLLGTAMSKLESDLLAGVDGDVLTGSAPAMMSRRGGSSTPLGVQTMRLELPLGLRTSNRYIEDETILELLSDGSFIDLILDLQSNLQSMQSQADPFGVKHLRHELELLEIMQLAIKDNTNCNELTTDWQADLKRLDDVVHAMDKRESLQIQLDQLIQTQRRLSENERQLSDQENARKASELRQKIEGMNQTIEQLKQLATLHNKTKMNQTELKRAVRLIRNYSTNVAIKQRMNQLQSMLQTVEAWEVSWFAQVDQLKVGTRDNVNSKGVLHGIDHLASSLESTLIELLGQFVKTQFNRNDLQDELSELLVFYDKSTIELATIKRLMKNINDFLDSAGGTSGSAYEGMLRQLKHSYNIVRTFKTIYLRTEKLKLRLEVLNELTALFRKHIDRSIDKNLAFPPASKVEGIMRQIAIEGEPSVALPSPEAREMMGGDSEQRAGELTKDVASRQLPDER